jgi:hypothetical protein
MAIFDFTCCCSSSSSSSGSHCSCSTIICVDPCNGSSGTASILIGSASSSSSSMDSSSSSDSSDDDAEDLSSSSLSSSESSSSTDCSGIFAAANLGGCTTVCIDCLGGAGSYPIQVTSPGFQTYNNTKALACNSSTTVELLASSQASITINVAGCCGPLAGASVVIGGISTTTDSSGTVTAAIGEAGVIEWSVSAPTFQTQSGSVTLAECSTTGQGISVQLIPDDGFACVPAASCCGFNNDPQAFNYPLPISLSLTDSVAGSCTMTFANGAWTGSITFTMPPYQGMQEQTITLVYTFPSAAGAPTSSQDTSVPVCGGCGVNISSTAPLGSDFLPCAWGNQAFIAGETDPSQACGCGDPNPDPGIPQVLCATTEGCSCLSLSVSADGPGTFLLEQQMSGCDGSSIISDAGAFIFFCVAPGTQPSAGVTGFGCIYGSGSAPMITMME